jgi:DNA polymerase III subunit delta
MTPEEAIRKAKKGQLPAVLLVSGNESLLASEVLSAVREQVMVGGIAGLNDDTLEAGPSKVEDVLALARTLPMLATKRLVVVRNVERWEEKESKAAGKAKEGRIHTPPLDQLVEYATKANPSTVLVLIAPTLDKRRRIYTTAKKEEWLVSCETPNRAELAEWVMSRARASGSKMNRNVAELLLDLIGPTLGPLADAIERVCLYSGEGNLVEEAAVSECVVRVRTASAWELVSAVGRRDPKSALAVLHDVYDPHDRGLPLIGILAWATRQLLRFDAAKQSGQSSADAAKAAGAPPFKARELEMQLRGLSSRGLGRWLELLSSADLALKGGSKRDPRATLTQMVLDMCSGE